MRNYNSRYRSPRRVKKQQSPFFRKRSFWLGVFAVGVIGALSYVFVFSSFFQIKEIKIAGNGSVPIEIIKARIEKKIEKQILNLSLKNIFLINPNEIQKDILENFPELARADIEREFPHTVAALVFERAPAAKWCKINNGYDDFQNSEKCFYIDKEGIIFEEALAETPLLKIMNNGELNDPSLGDRVIGGDLLSHILKIESKLKENFKISVSEFLIISQDRLNVKMEEGWEAYFNPKEDMDWQLTKLVLVLEKEIPPDLRRNLEYIELRFGERAYFKFKD